MNTPNHVGDETINELFELATEITREHAKNLQAEPDLAAKLDSDPLAQAAYAAELFFHTNKRHRPDIYECRDCNHQFPQEATCPECQSKNMFLFMRAPSRAEVRQYANLRETEDEAALTELDPDWREHFGGDADRARDFYNGVEPEPKPRSRVIHHSNATDPTDYSDRRDDEVNFDDDLESR